MSEARGTDLSSTPQPLLKHQPPGRSDGGSATDGIPRRAHDLDPAPLSLGQQRLWFLEQMNPGSFSYHLSGAIRLRGRLDTSALERSLGEIVRRHEALRTTFQEVAGGPVQVVREDVAFRLGIARLRLKLTRGASEDELETYIRLHAEEEVRRPFDLVNGPLIRVTLLRRSPRDQALLWTLHHLVSDGWSMGVFWRELQTLYGAFAADRPSPLPELPIQYADFAVWERARLEGGVLDEQIAYWKQHLAGMAAFELPADRPRLAAQTSRSARHALVLPTPLKDALKALGGQEGATLFMTLLATFQALLARYTGEEDVAVGVPIAGRTRAETQGLIGFFVNTLVLRIDLSGDPPFREVLGRVRKAALRAYRRQEVPFERLVAELQPERSVGRMPLVPVAFTLQNARIPSPDLPGLAGSRMDTDTGIAKFDLLIELREVDGELQGWLEYRTDLFEADTIARLAGHFRTLLDAVVANPDQPLSALPLLSPDERHRMLVEWNATATDYPADATVHRLFEAQAARTPAAVAVVAGDEALAYRELDRRANRLAHHLRGLGVSRNVPVGLCVERGPAMVVGMLGILKAGGAYLPLDPAYPPERLALMLADAAAPVLVTSERLAAALPPHGARVVSLDADRSPIARASDTAPPVAATADDLAYVIYTSGSTGVPKGVAVPHRAVTRLVIDTDYVRLTGDDVVAQAANAAFDAATFEIWGALLNGGRLIVIPTEAVLSPPNLATHLRRHGVTTLFLTTALFNQVASEAADAVSGLRQVLFGGEAVDPQRVATVLKHGPPERLLHVYGPTETTTFATWYPVDRVGPGATTLPIGRPIANTRAYVLDAVGQPVPIGVPGELFLGGPGVARGYLGRPELTAERFVPDPFSCEPEARLYRTGDRVRYLPDGNLEFLGRGDRQVKIRGFRVEPGEVEAKLARHPDVAEALVVAWEPSPGDRRLVAYIVPMAEVPPAVGELRASLKASLPDYMLPAAFVPLPMLPLTPNGKVDHRALPPPGKNHVAPASVYAAPRTPDETTVAAVWSRLLGIDRVSIHDNFFDLGGHSLLVTQVLAGLRAELGVELPVQAVFEAPTVATLAERVAQARREGPTPAIQSSAEPVSIVTLQAGTAKRPLFVVPGGNGEPSNLFKIAQLARRLGTDQPVYGFWGDGGPEEDGGADDQAWVEAIATAYLREMRRYQPDGPYLLAGTCVGGIIAFEMAQQLAARGEVVGRLVLMDTPCPSDQGADALREREVARLARRGVDEADADAVLDDLSVRGRRLHRYRPRPYPGQITLFVNEEWHREAPALGWDAVPSAGLDVNMVPGDHRTYLIEHLGGVADRLRAHLDMASALTETGA